MDLAVYFVVDSVNLWTKLLPRSSRILIEQRLNPIVVLLKRRPNLLLLFCGQLQIFRKVSEFLVDRLRRVDLLKVLTRRGLLCCFLGHGRTNYAQHQHNSIGKRKADFAWTATSLNILDAIRAETLIK
jgi:hypothetical protein